MTTTIPAALLLLSATSTIASAQTAGYPPYPTPYPTAPPAAAFLPIAPGIDILTRRDPQGYTLIINSSRLPVAVIRVDITPYSLLIHASDQRQRNQRQQGRPNGRPGHFQSYSYSSSQQSFTQRLPMPPDADPSGAVREHHGQQITIFIPLRAG
jgi:hypothetical protein